jgi:hypothetical protein
MIELTEKQREAVRNGEAIRVAMPEIGEDVVLLRATEYENLQELLADKDEQAAILRYSMRQARTIAKENPY